MSRQLLEIIEDGRVLDIVERGLFLEEVYWDMLTGNYIVIRRDRTTGKVLSSCRMNKVMR
ncbi:hypothetical protein LCGC14_1544800 [marine sediment metagenome]|uniref:Uncharacterized protein n=1 Tax=marine sediment metagenome TaxID=412755 RepID=A0A0F9LSQ9_9ZZZZ